VSLHGAAVVDAACRDQGGGFREAALPASLDNLERARADSRMADRRVSDRGRMAMCACTASRSSLSERQIDRICRFG
jgi:hypothetical protein